MIILFCFSNLFIKKKIGTSKKKERSNYDQILPNELSYNAEYGVFNFILMLMLIYNFRTMFLGKM